jgi:hypothetical protein
MQQAVESLRARFHVRECGSDGQCCFSVLHCIEFLLGANRRALQSCQDADEHTQTRARIAAWIARNEHTAFIKLPDNALQTVGEAIERDRPSTEMDAFQRYYGWIAAEGCGGEIEIASFAAMCERVASLMISVLFCAYLHNTKVQYQNNEAQPRALP